MIAYHFASCIQYWMTIMSNEACSWVEVRHCVLWSCWIDWDEMNQQYVQVLIATLQDSIHWEVWLLKTHVAHHLPWPCLVRVCELLWLRAWCVFEMGSLMYQMGSMINNNMNYKYILYIKNGLSLNLTYTWLHWRHHAIQSICEWKI